MGQVQSGTGGYHPSAVGFDSSNESPLERSRSQRGPDLKRYSALRPDRLFQHGRTPSGHLRAGSTSTSALLQQHQASHSHVTHALAPPRASAEAEPHSATVQRRSLVGPIRARPQGPQLSGSSNYTYTSQDSDAHEMGIAADPPQRTQESTSADAGIDADADAPLLSSPSLEQDYWMHPSRARAVSLGTSTEEAASTAAAAAAVRASRNSTQYRVASTPAQPRIVEVDEPQDLVTEFGNPLRALADRGSDASDRGHEPFPLPEPLARALRIGLGKGAVSPELARQLRSEYERQSATLSPLDLTGPAVGETRRTTGETDRERLLAYWRMIEAQGTTSVEASRRSSLLSYRSRPHSWASERPASRSSTVPAPMSRSPSAHAQPAQAHAAADAQTSTSSVWPSVRMPGPSDQSTPGPIDPQLWTSEWPDDRGEPSRSTSPANVPLTDEEFRTPAGTLQRFSWSDEEDASPTADAQTESINISDHVDGVTGKSAMSNMQQAGNQTGRSGSATPRPGKQTPAAIPLGISSKLDSVWAQQHHTGTLERQAPEQRPSLNDFLTVSYHTPADQRSRTSLLSAAAASSQAEDEHLEPSVDAFPSAPEAAEAPIPSPSSPRRPPASPGQSSWRKPVPAASEREWKEEGADQVTDMKLSPTHTWRRLDTDFPDRPDSMGDTRGSKHSSQLSRGSNGTDALLAHVEQIRAGPAFRLDATASIELLGTPSDTSLFDARQVSDLSGSPSGAKRPRALSLIDKIRGRVRRGSESTRGITSSPKSPTKVSAPTTPVSPASPWSSRILSPKRERGAQATADNDADGISDGMSSLTAVPRGRASATALRNARRRSGTALTIKGENDSVVSLQRALADANGLRPTRSRSPLKSSPHSRPRSVHSVRSARSRRSSAPSLRASYRAGELLPEFQKSTPARGYPPPLSGMEETRLQRALRAEAEWEDVQEQNRVTDKTASGETGAPQTDQAAPSKKAGRWAWRKRNDSESAPGDSTDMTRTRTQSEASGSEAAAGAHSSRTVPHSPATEQEGDRSLAANRRSASLEIVRIERKPDMDEQIGVRGLHGVYGADNFSSLAPVPPPAPVPPLRPSRRTRRTNSTDGSSGSSPTSHMLGGLESENDAIAGASSAAPSSTQEPALAATNGGFDPRGLQPWTPGAFRRPRPMPHSPVHSTAAEDFPPTRSNHRLEPSDASDRRHGHVPGLDGTEDVTDDVHADLAAQKSAGSLQKHSGAQAQPVSQPASVPRNAEPPLAPHDTSQLSTSVASAGPPVHQRRPGSVRHTRNLSDAQSASASPRRTLPALPVLQTEHATARPMRSTSETIGERPLSALDHTDSLARRSRIADSSVSRRESVSESAGGPPPSRSALSHLAPPSLDTHVDRTSWTSNDGPWLGTVVAANARPGRVQGLASASRAPISAIQTLRPQAASRLPIPVGRSRAVSTPTRPQRLEGLAQQPHLPLPDASAPPDREGGHEDGSTPVPYADTAVQASLAALAALESSKEDGWRARWAKTKLFGAPEIQPGQPAWLDESPGSRADLSQSELSDYSNARPRRRAAPYPKTREASARRASDAGAISSGRSETSRRQWPKAHVSRQASLGSQHGSSHSEARHAHDATGMADIYGSTTSMRGFEALSASERTMFVPGSDARSAAGSANVARQGLLSDPPQSQRDAKRYDTLPFLTPPRQRSRPAGRTPQRAAIPSFASDHPAATPGPRLPSDSGTSAATALNPVSASSDATSPVMRSPANDWDEQVVPALQKRLELEAEEERKFAAAAAASAALPRLTGPGTKEEHHDSPSVVSAFGAESLPVFDPVHEEDVAGEPKVNLPFPRHAVQDSPDARRRNAGASASPMDSGRRRTQSGYTGRRSPRHSRTGGKASALPRLDPDSGDRPRRSSERNGERRKRYDVQASESSAAPRSTRKSSAGSHKTRRPAKQGYSGEDIKAWQAALAVGMTEMYE
ncbi:hypothetical protein IE81DRAFT_10427 [Ceraceosorus guamensis]|uniref:Uncharacterized protein n=1 Tax=Ceraceosorus guamensis TaxID=1522189 RepID=A0A316W938_9BASI|nr:hypothetical protein IE81DRAFT_10427 [Ceraceosorus guamensis]PWN44553.1 hypothetical protein IE81DRAFT_10427 [Ceraceosorus guamensis]